VGALVAVVPFFYTVSVSLMNLTEAPERRLAAQHTPVQNYVNAWNQANFSQYSWNSVRISAITLLASCILHVGCLCLCAYGVLGQELLFSLLLATLMLQKQ